MFYLLWFIDRFILTDLPVHLTSARLAFRRGKSGFNGGIIRARIE